MMRRLQTRMRGSFGGKRGDGGGPAMGGGRAFALAGGALALLWVASGYYQVDAGQRGVVTTFGVHTATTGPGPHLRLPWPVQNHYVIDVQQARSTRVGPVSESDPENLMITRDQALVNVGFDAVWRVSDARDFVFEVRNVPGREGDLVAAATESAMREIVGQRDLDDVITTGRAAIAEAARAGAQEILDSYDAGIEVQQINMRPLAPRAVSDAFADVLAANQDRETSINAANRYANETVPRARGQSQQMIQEAEAYRERVVREAAGEAERFRLIYEEYRASPRVTRDRLYLETMERVYRRADKIIVDQGSGVSPYLPLDQLRRGQQQAAAQPNASGAAR